MYKVIHPAPGIAFISINTIFFLNSSKIFFSYSSLEPPYSKNILWNMLPSNPPISPRVEAKHERFKVKKCSFSRKFSADNLLTLLNLTIHAANSNSDNMSER